MPYTIIKVIALKGHNMTIKKSAQSKVTKPKRKSLSLLEILLTDASRYDETKHCTLATDILKDQRKGTIAHVCKEAIITEREFKEWRRDYPNFNVAVEYGLVISKLNWQNEPERFEEEKTELEHFDFNKWKFVGKYRYGIGDSPKIQVAIDKRLNPIEQYGQLLDCAAMGEFTASEFKQVSEAINIGIRAHETFSMQQDLDELKQTLKDIQERQASNGFNIPAD